MYKGEKPARISLLIKALNRLAPKNMTFMEVCGTHTVSIFRNGIRSVVPQNIRLLSGPGCPVCVTAQGDIDAIIETAGNPGIIVATYGDMMRVPGTSGSLAQKRSEGADIRIITTASSCIDLALQNPSKEILFLAIGFETTAPATASMLMEAKERAVHNISVACFHKRTPPVLEKLAMDKDLKIDGFLLPGHVSVILGYEPYRFLADSYGIACSITGFEAEDILLGLADLAKQVMDGTPCLHSTYQRAVKPGGNKLAVELMEKVFVNSNAVWRGIGEIPDSGMKLNENFRDYDAISKLDMAVRKVAPPKGCRCGDVLSGRITPRECPLFAKGCDPVNPIGPCMVSGEGTCSAYYKYSRGGRF